MQSNFYRDILDSLSDGVYFVDTQRRISYWNRAAERLTGYGAEEVVGKTCAENFLRHVDEHGRQLCLTGCPLTLTMSDGRSREATVYMHHKEGHRMPVHIRATPMRDARGRIVGAVETFQRTGRDADVFRKMEELRQEVLSDGLTGIANRRYADIAMDRLDSIMRDGSLQLGAIFVDLDHFKQINDTWGHGVGDRVLIMVAKTLESSLRPADVACRWGGEEFVVLVPNTSREKLGILARRLRMLVEQSFIVHGEERISVTASMGLALSRPGEPARCVVDRADNEAYFSKRSGRNCISMEGACLSMKQPETSLDETSQPETPADESPADETLAEETPLDHAQQPEA